LNPGNKQIKKLFRSHVDAHLGIGLDLGEAFDDIPSTGWTAGGVGMKNVALNFVAAVGDGFSAGEFAARFHVDMHGGRIVLESMPGVGTRVTVIFPAASTLEESALRVA